MAPGMEVTCFGAVRTVTGSMHLVETSGVRLLLDCGLFQGRRDESYEVNAHLPFPPSSIDAVVLSHAHLDHCGNLPTLVRQGFAGPIYCTPATRDLAGLILRDSAKVQHQDAVFLAKRGRTGAKPSSPPLYSAEEAEAAIGHLVGVPYGRAFPIGGATVTFRDAGHILGSAVTSIQAAGRTLGFTGDLGRPGAPILRDPELLPAVDVLLMESTYGTRRHPPIAEGERKLGEIVSETVAGGGKVLIPSFAVGRAQDITYALHRLRETGRVPAVATYVDSPMAVDATEIFRLHPECFDDEVRTHLEWQDPFGFKGLSYLRSAEESKTLNTKAEPFLVIATSGMCESGRILQHLRHHIADPKSVLLIVGFQAVNTLGRRLVDGVSPVRIYGEPFDVRLRVAVLAAFSAHADGAELVEWVQRVPKVGRAYCVHGEEGEAAGLAGVLSARGIPTEIPPRGQPITV
jgi:metallo-beta-lactamase family protein